MAIVMRSIPLVISLSSVASALWNQCEFETPVKVTVLTIITQGGGIGSATCETGTCYVCINGWYSQCVQSPCPISSGGDNGQELSRPTNDTNIEQMEIVDVEPSQRPRPRISGLFCK
jgi:hypothetical protein